MVKQRSPSVALDGADEANAKRAAPQRNGEASPLHFRDFDCLFHIAVAPQADIGSVPESGSATGPLLRLHSPNLTPADPDMCPFGLDVSDPVRPLFVLR